MWTVISVDCNSCWTDYISTSSKWKFNHENGKVVGSELIGQQWESRKYFHGRISAVNYNMNNQEVNSNGGPASGGSNFGNSNPKLKQRVKEMIQQEGKARSVDAVTASASGLDPDITVKNAEQQAQRIAKARDIDVSKVNHVIVENKNLCLWLMIMSMF